MNLRKAKNSDVPQIRALINKMAARTDADNQAGHMLPRSLTELYEHIRDYTVLVEDDRLLGCCALQSTWDGLAELKALAVDDEAQGLGWGRRLVEAAISEADDLGIECIFTLTNKMDFFTKLQFIPIDMRALPQRVWSECTRCPKFMVACDEVAMTYLGRQPKPTYIPALGVNAPAAAKVALEASAARLLPSGQQAVPANDPHSPHEPPPVPRGPMNSDGVHPPFAPEI